MAVEPPGDTGIGSASGRGEDRCCTGDDDANIVQPWSTRKPADMSTDQYSESRTAVPAGLAAWFGSGGGTFPLQGKHEAYPS